MSYHQMTSRIVPSLEEDNRLLPMLTSLSKRYLGADYSNKKSTAGLITADMIDAVGRPPLMRRRLL